MLTLGVLISGRGSNLQALIDACAEDGFPARIGLVISNKADAKGLDRAKAAGIPTAVVSHKDFGDKASFEAALTEVLKAAGVDLVCLAGFMRLLSQTFLDAWPDKVVNIHPSLLPSFKGLDTHERALETGVKLAGCTVHFVRVEMDAGPIIGQAAVPVLSDDTPESLAARILEAEHRLYARCVRLIAEGRVRVEGARTMIDGDEALSGILSAP